jgi:hypothetical protein
MQGQIIPLIVISINIVIIIIINVFFIAPIHVFSWLHFMLLRQGTTNK